MRLLKFNGENVDIDDTTAIGIDLQAYDFSDPGNRKVSISNSFTIPLTANNMRLIGHAGNPHSMSTTVYELIVVQYYNDNRQLIKNGSAKITKISDRINVTIVEKDDFWALLSDYLFPDFLVEFITWMQMNKGLPSSTDPFIGTFQNFVDGYIATTEGLFLPFYISNLANYSPDEVTYLEDTTKLYLKYNAASSTEVALGGHFAVYCKTIFEFIQEKYDVDFSVLSTDYDYNIFEDEIASLMFIPARNISIENTTGGYYFSVDTTNNFLPEEDLIDKESSSMYDFTKSFFQHFNCLIDKIPTLDLKEKYIIRRFDEIQNAPIVDFSGGFDKKYTQEFKPIADNYKQVNYIKFESVYEDGNELLNAKKIVCLNKNLEAGGTDNALFSIDAFIPAQFELGVDAVPNMSEAESFDTFVFFISEGQSTVEVKTVNNGVTETANVILKLARTYSLESEYNTIASMAARPILYTIKKWLSLSDIENMVYFARYWVQELNGYYFVNKISGFNPDKSTEGTSIELIKIQ